MLVTVGLFNLIMAARSLGALRLEKTSSLLVGNSLRSHNVAMLVGGQAPCVSPRTYSTGPRLQIV